MSSCTSIEYIKQDLTGGEVESIIRTAVWLQKNEVKDTSVTVQLLTHILDPRLCSSSSKYYLETPYVNRVLALEKVTGKKCPYKIEEKLNASIVDYYLEWAVNKKLIKTKDDIDVIPPYIKEIEDSKSFINDILNNQQVKWLKKYNWEKPPFNDDKFHN